MRHFSIFGFRTQCVTLSPSAGAEQPDPCLHPRRHLTPAFASTWVSSSLMVLFSSKSQHLNLTLSSGGWGLRTLVRKSYATVKPAVKTKTKQTNKTKQKVCLLFRTNRGKPASFLKLLLKHINVEWIWGAHSDLVHFFMVCLSQILCLPLRKKLWSCFLPALLIILRPNTVVTLPLSYGSRATLHNTCIVTQNSAIIQLQYRGDYIKSSVYSVLIAS